MLVNEVVIRCDALHSAAIARDEYQGDHDAQSYREEEVVQQVSGQGQEVGRQEEEVHQEVASTPDAANG